MRASDDEREAVVERLRTASVEGRLTLTELTERTEAAYLAQTHTELAQVTADLPGGMAQAPYQAPLAPSAPQSRGGAKRWFVAIMGDSKQRGKWRIDREIAALCVMGDVEIDLREAEVRTNEVLITAYCMMGDIKIIVPDGVDIELSGVAIMGDRKVNVVEAPPGQNVPVIRINANVLMGDIKVIGDSHAKPIKRGMFAWSGWWQHRRLTQHHNMHNLGMNAVADAMRGITGDTRATWQEEPQQQRQQSPVAGRQQDGPPPPPPAPPGH